MKSSYCDCPGCRKATGTFKAPFLTVYQKEFKIVAGELASFQAESGERCDAFGAWYFCPRCGTHVYWKGHQGDELDIFAGTLANADLFQLEK